MDSGLVLNQSLISIIKRCAFDFPKCDTVILVNHTRILYIGVFTIINKTVNYGLYLNKVSNLKINVYFQDKLKMMKHSPMFLLTKNK